MPQYYTFGASPRGRLYDLHEESTADDAMGPPRTDALNCRASLDCSLFLGYELKLYLQGERKRTRGQPISRWTEADSMYWQLDTTARKQLRFIAGIALTNTPSKHGPEYFCGKDLPYNDGSLLFPDWIITVEPIRNVVRLFFLFFCISSKISSNFQSTSTY